MEQEKYLETALALIKEFRSNTPDIWESIKRRVAEEVAKELLRDLEGLPSCEGRVLSQLKNEILEKTHISMRMGA
jgi:hypothetical protein